MVNKKPTSTRTAILNILSGAAGPVSGEAMANTLGCSRVAVWKGIQALNAAGYLIETTSSGYRLSRAPVDSLDPWAIQVDETRYRHVATVDSTMTLARQAALSGAESGYTITADAQTAGRGTGTHRWESPSGGLFYTIVTRPTLLAAYSHRRVLAAQCALVRALDNLGVTNAAPRWPNDIVLRGTDGAPRKIGGILAESLAVGNRLEYLNLGIGVNTAPDAAPGRYATVSLSRADVLRAFQGSFTDVEGAADEDDRLIAEWNALSARAGDAAPRLGEAVAFRRYRADGSLGPAETGAYAGVDRAGWISIDEHAFPPGSITICNLEKGQRP